MKKVFGTLKDGTPVMRYELTNGALCMGVIDWGATIVSLQVPFQVDQKDDGAPLRTTQVVLGMPSLEHYETITSRFGSIIGRYANRIKEGKFSIDGKSYTLATNNGRNHLHGGRVGFDMRSWSLAELGERHVSLQLVSEDGDQGYPGALTVMVTYRIHQCLNRVSITYCATCDGDTVVNLTNHSFFNLGGERTVNGHVVRVLASRYTPSDAGLIPQGALRQVEGVLDLRQGVLLADAMHSEELMETRGFDHNYVLDDGSSLAASLEYKGRVMQMQTSEPALQFYTGGFLDGTIDTRDGSAKHQQFGGLCLEAQHYPDSPNQPSFPTTLLRPGETYKQTTVYSFC